MTAALSHDATMLADLHRRHAITLRALAHVYDGLDAQHVTATMVRQVRAIAADAMKEATR